MLSTMLRLFLVFSIADICAAAKFKKLKAITYNVGLLKRITDGFDITREARRDKIIQALQTTNADLVCLQEAWLAEDVEAIVNGTGGVYPYSFSKVHNSDGTVDGSPAPDDGPLCNATLFSAYFACVINNCDPTAPVDDFIQCSVTACLTEFVATFAASSEDCLTCFTTFFPSATDVLARCAGVGPSPALKKINAPGLLLLSRKRLTKTKFVDFFPDTVQFITRGYLTAKVGGKLQAVCTHLSAIFSAYLEINLMNRFSSYAEQNRYEVGRLVKAFSKKNRVLLLGDFNTGPSTPGGIPAVNIESYMALNSTFETQAVGVCTFCPSPENSYNGEYNEMIDHVFGKGLKISRVKRIFTRDQSTLYLNSTQLSLSDHDGVEAKLTKMKRSE